MRKKSYLCTVILSELNILNYRNIRDASLSFSDKLNCFVGLNGQGKTNLLDAIYLLSFTKSALSPLDSQNITHGEELAMVRGTYLPSTIHRKYNLWLEERGEEAVPSRG